MERADTESLRNFPKLEPFMKEINEWLEEDKKARSKQRHTAKRVFNRLQKKYKDKFDCSYRTTAAYISVKKGNYFRKTLADCLLSIHLAKPRRTYTFAIFLLHS
ncbi:MAG: hypothetical protein ACYDEJ_09725 [Desulfitobacteriaceae bacterium]